MKVGDGVWYWKSIRSDLFTVNKVEAIVLKVTEKRAYIAYVGEEGILLRRIAHENLEVKDGVNNRVLLDYGRRYPSRSEEAKKRTRARNALSFAAQGSVRFGD